MSDVHAPPESDTFTTAADVARRLDLLEAKIDRISEVAERVDPLIDQLAELGHTLESLPIPGHLADRLGGATGGNAGQAPSGGGTQR